MGKTGILLVNLGSPDSPAIPDVRRYLAEFLMDPYVIDTPWLLRALIVYGTILPSRPKDTSHAYSQIWTEEGSPLITISQEVQTLLQAQIADPVSLGMRYGNPSIEFALRDLIQKTPNLSQVILVPLYPHYAMSSFETVVERTKWAISKINPALKLAVIPPFYQHPAYIEALVESAKPYMSGGDHLLISYHGLPERHLKKSDPTGCHCLASESCCQTPSVAHATCYKAQALKTASLLTAQLGLSHGDYSLAFQSRLGRDPWLKPYTDEVLVELAQKGVKKLNVICPAFVSDCLETIEEIGQRGRESFIQAGGDSLTLIPCLNTHPKWIQALVTLCGEVSK